MTEKTQGAALPKIAAIKQERRRIDELNPAAYNPRKRLKPGDEEYEALKRSVKTFGYVDPIIVNADGTVIGGHQRLKVLIDLGYSEVDVAVVDLSKSDEKALNIALNKISGEWDEEKLAEIFRELNLEGYDTSVTGFDRAAVEALTNAVAETVECADEYSTKVEVPTYQVTGETPAIDELYSTSKMDQLLQDIESDRTISDDEKEFLRMAATRHVVFDYRNIAEYYAAASPAMQGLMEDSALVIVDFDKAIENGYVKLKTALSGMVDEGDDDEI